MAKRKVASTAGESAVNVQEIQAPVQSFWEKYQQILVYGVGAAAVALLGWWLYNSMIVAPKQKEAVNAMWQAQLQFKRDSFKLALENPGGGYDGFLAIIDKYSGTDAANLSKYYAGVCYLQTGDLDNAIQYLEDFDAEGNVLPTMKYGILGDCYSEKQDFDKALSMYEKAANATENEVLAPVFLKKYAMLSERQGNKAQAKEAYERIKRDFPNQASTDWREIDKYIYRLGEVK